MKTLRVILTQTNPATYLKEIVVEGDSDEQCHERVTHILKENINLVSWLAIESND